MYNILKLNDISQSATDILSGNYKLTKECANPDGIVLRSFNMHEYAINDELIAVARAGAGVNNIPIPALTEKGIAVFNTPGANANAVKELVVCSMILASRKIVRSIDWAQGLKGQEGVAKLVEKGKKAFVGPEIAGKTLGVIGLGAIGRMVANAAVSLDMNVLGYDPYISVDGAWSLSRAVKHVTKLSELFKNCDYITVHVPFTPETNGVINKESLSQMKDGIVIINCARGELVNNVDIIEAVKSGKVGRYVTDFPTEELLGIENIITIPHLGASTPEAEENCAIMAANQLKDYIENGNIVNSVNLPYTVSPRMGKYRICIIHKNVANMISKATGIVSARNINIENMTSTSKGEVAYMIMDINQKPDTSLLDEFKNDEGFVKVRVID